MNSISKDTIIALATPSGIGAVAMIRISGEKSIEFVRSVAEGDLIALHTHQTWPDQEEYVTMDFFRFDANGKIVEHWDAMQQIPKTSANNNTMY